MQGLQKRFHMAMLRQSLICLLNKLNYPLKNDVVSESAIDSQKELRTYFMNNTPQSFKMVHNGVSGKKRPLYDRRVNHL